MFTEQQLSPNFKLSQMLVSETATRNNFTEQFNPSAQIIANLQSLCQNVLEPLRAKIGRPVIVTSGYRCERVNGSVAGSANHSQHELGCAADTHVEGISIENWYQFIKTAGVPFGQLIQEHNLWAHVSIDPAAQRGQCLRAGGSIAQPTYLADGEGSFKNG
jgi:zinc D-Ala-D-Ala carboxypeptidase